MRDVGDFSLNCPRETRPAPPFALYLREAELGLHRLPLPTC